jgi:hypothetical protein
VRRPVVQIPRTTHNIQLNRADLQSIARGQGRISKEPTVESRSPIARPDDRAARTAQNPAMERRHAARRQTDRAAFRRANRALGRLYLDFPPFMLPPGDTEDKFANLDS